MFIIELDYIKSLEEVDKFLAVHRAFLDEGYAKNYFIASGPKNPRTGGIILSNIESRKQLEAIIEKDPFYIEKIAEYKITEFVPVKYDQNFSKYVK